MISYFAYGMYMCLNKIMENECIIIGKPKKAVLKGYKICFPIYLKEFDGGIPTINKSKDKDDYVNGVLYQLDNLYELDKNEGCFYQNKNKSNWYRKQFEVETVDGKIKAWAYYLNSEEKIKTSYSPSNYYLNLMLYGGKERKGGLLGVGFSEKEIKEYCKIINVDYRNLKEFYGNE